MNPDKQPMIKPEETQSDFLSNEEIIDAYLDLDTYLETPEENDDVFAAVDVHRGELEERGFKDFIDYLVTTPAALAVLGRTYTLLTDLEQRRPDDELEMSLDMAISVLGDTREELRK